MTARESILSRLRETAFRPQHDYRVSLQIFPALNVGKLADDLNVIDLGAARGAENSPPGTTAGFDEVELRIVEKMTSEQQAAAARLQDELQIYDERLSSLDFEGRFADLNRAAPEAISSFRAEAALGRDELNSLRRAIVEAENERAEFQSKHGLTRAPRPATFASNILKGGLLLVLLLVETIFNGHFLAVGNIAGLLGGITQAAAFAALNVFVSFGIAFLFVRRWNVKGVLGKVVGGLSFTFYIAFAILINIGLAHFRDVSATFSEDAGQLVMQRLATTPFVIKDVESWTFFGIGLVFSTFAFLDGLFFSDPYPGYGEVETRRQKAFSAYTEHKASLVEKLQDIRDQTSEDIKEVERDLGVRRAEHDNILQARSRIVTQFKQFEKHVEIGGNSILQRYREANEQKRTKKAPKHFSKAWVLDRVDATAGLAEGLARSDLRQQIKDNQASLNLELNEIHAEFERIIQGYRQVDDLVGDTAGPPVESLAPDDRSA